MPKTAPMVALALMATLMILRWADGDENLRKRIDDENGKRTDVWIYNDIAHAREEAKRTNKPLFVTFRCVPCQACAAFDADVANGNERIRDFAKKEFVSVRQVEMKGVDLSLFEFDHDLNWAAMFINADGTVYARYGTQSAEGPDAYNSIDGLLKTMQRVIKLHSNYPNNRPELQGKRGSRRRGVTALTLPGMQNAKKLEKETTRSNCIHCHMIHDAEHFSAQRLGDFKRDILWKYPLPDNLGLKMNRSSGIRVAKVVANSPAAAAGFVSGDDIRRLNGQRITSIADIQWVLHKLPNRETTLEAETMKGAKRAIKLKPGWKEYDISWRGSIWSVSPRLRVWAPELPENRRKELDLANDKAAFLVKWINRGEAGGRSAYESGLRQGDIIVEMDGKTMREMTAPQFNLHIKLKYKIGDELPLTVVRKGRKLRLRIRLVE